MKKLFLIFLLLPAFSFWLTWNCNYTGFKITWPDVVKTSFSVDYSISWIKNIDWKIEKNNNIVITTDGEKFNYAFKQPWEIKLKASFLYKDCNLQLEKKVKIFDKIILVVDIKDDFLSSLPLDKKNIFIKFTSLDNLTWFDIKLADWIFLPSNKAIDFFSTIFWADLQWKNIVVFASSFKGFLKKLIIPYIKDLKNSKVYLYDYSQLLNVVSKIYKNQQLDDWNIISSNQKTFLPLSYFVNKLLEKWLDLNILGIILVAVFWTLIIAFFRQVIGFSVFGVYTPLIFSVLIVVFGYKITLLLFVLSLLASIITHIITSKFYVLYSSKISLNYIVYAIITIFLIGFLFNHIDFSTINLSIVVLFVIFPYLTKNLIREDTKFLSKGFWVFILEFVMITAFLLILFKISLIKNILIAYPDLLWVLLILAILIGRFTWLQLFEYIRFAPLIKKSLYEEE